MSRKRYCRIRFETEEETEDGSWKAICCDTGHPIDIDNLPLVTVEDLRGLAQKHARGERVILHTEEL